LLITSRLLFARAAPTVLYTLSLHDALPIYREHPLLVLTLEGDDLVVDRVCLLGLVEVEHVVQQAVLVHVADRLAPGDGGGRSVRSEEHTSELQSRENLVCRLLLEKKKQQKQ